MKIAHLEALINLMAVKQLKFVSCAALIAYHALEKRITAWLVNKETTFTWQNATANALLRPSQLRKIVAAGTAQVIVKHATNQQPLTA